ncbi:MAG: nicotinate (nicotinamide) nucleotide adenylyltransferase [Candidatus Hydrogenedentota bacterium]
MPRRIGLFGGLFNPPHLGHLILAERAREAARLDIVYWIPAGKPPHKTIDDPRPSPAERFRMVEESIAGHAAFRALDFEASRDSTCYSIETVRHVESMHPGAELYYVLGEDAFGTVNTWKNADELRDKVTFAVYPRPSSAAHAPNHASFRSLRFPAPAIEISSSDIRTRLRACRSIRYLVHDAALRMIEENAWYSAVIPELLMEHIRMVEDFAVTLAARWNASPDVLRVAVRHHDAYKTMTFEESVSVLRERGEAILEIETRFPVLLHGRVAAARLENTAFALKGDDLDHAVEAVRHHTLGRIGMSKTCEILMIADRAGKDWLDVNEVPADLHEAVRQMFGQKLADLKKRGQEMDKRLFETARSYGVSL